MSTVPLCPVEARLLFQTACLAFLLYASRGACQAAPASPDHPWHSSEEREFAREAGSFRYPVFPMDPAKTYSLAELIDLAETQNPETRVAWERARAQADALGIARSELYPALAAIGSLPNRSRRDVFFGTSFYRQTVGNFEGELRVELHSP
jgi:outer membrane protein